MPTRHAHLCDYLAFLATGGYVLAILVLWFKGPSFADLGPISDWFGHASQVYNGIQALPLLLHRTSYPQHKLHIADYILSSATLVVVVALLVFNGFQASEHYWINAIWWNALLAGLVDMILLGIAHGMTKLRPA